MLFFLYVFLRIRLLWGDVFHSATSIYKPKLHSGSDSLIVSSLQVTILHCSQFLKSYKKAKFGLFKMDTEIPPLI
jgi:hypothetical protein